MGQHYIPQHYLRGFCHEEKLWAHDKLNKRSFPVVTNNIAHEIGMWSNDVESFLSDEIENPANLVLDKIRQRTSITDEEKRHLARYIAILWKRVPNGRSRALGKIPEVAEELEAEILLEIDAAAQASEAVAERADTLRARVRAEIKRQKENPDHEIWYRSFEPEGGSYIIEPLLAMNWIYLCSDKQEFLTSDNPVFFFEHEGVGRPTSELTLPISSSITLWLTRKNVKSGSYLTASPQTIKQINRRTAHNSTRFVFSAKNEPWILAFVTKGEWPLSRIALSDR